ncbi:MAG: FAD-dependent monooxygenase [Pseudomonadota bacterium]
MSARRDFDVLIAGAGMVGAGLAALLSTGEATRALRIALVDPKPALAPLPGEPLDARVSALSRAGERVLRQTGAWPLLALRQPCAYERMVIWDSGAAVGGRDTLVFDAAEVGEPNLGHIVENRAVAAALVERAIAGGVTLLRSTVTGLDLTRDVATVMLGERALAVGLVVAADGADSPLRHLAGLGGEPTAYAQEAIVAHLRPAESHRGTAHQRFLPAGPLALLPLADGTVSLVWSTTPAQAERLVALDDAAFASEVTRASDGVLGTLTPVTGRSRFPLRRFNAASYAATRLALVGDAAHTVHPLAGQGVNQGFLDVAALVMELGAALARGGDPGDPQPLARYARARRAENALMGAALDGIYRLFSSDRPLLMQARQLGLGLASRAGPLKRLLVERALC